jgi:RNA recognition motif-containing protein
MSEAEAPPAIYIVGFETGATEEDFKTAFGGFGEIKDVALRGKDKPFAFVTFDTEEACDKAVAGSVKIGSTDVTVEKQTSKPRGRKPRRARGAKEDGAEETAPSTSIYIKGLPTESDAEALTEKVTSIFGEYGTVKSVVYKDKDFAFVEFEDEDSMKKALGASVKYEDADLTIEARETKGAGGTKKKKNKKKNKKPRVQGNDLHVSLPSCIF